MPTQTSHPWRATLRTIVAGIIGFAAIFPLIVEAADLPASAGVTLALAVTGAITRVMALPQVETFLKVHFGWLAAEPVAYDYDEGPDEVDEGE